MIRQKFKDVYTEELAQGSIINTRHPGFREDYLLLHCLIRKYRPASFFEIGTNGGFGTSIIKNAIGDGDVYSMDLPEDIFHQFQKYPERIGQECKVPYTQLYGDSMKFDYSKHRCEAYFVDGAHDMNHVHHEATEILKLKPKLIIFHDADIPDVEFGINMAFDDYDNYALYRVVGTRIAYAVKAEEL